MTEESLFIATLDQPTPEAREAFLVRACADDAGLLDRLRKLLDAHQRAAGILERGAPEPGHTGHFPAPRPEPPDDAPAPGRVFAGKYKLRQKLGEGGMGMVYVADQTEPVQRRVALKLIRAGADSESLLARFAAERQALALMDHPNIAKVLDAGVSATGEPYFVMELIKGVPITEYCDKAKLTPRERLELFVPVCQAVQHAHQKGIIHRDLKPSNILIGLYDGKPVPKVIDFGVAKAIGPRLTDQSIYTEVGSLVGTLEYMSPEQAELNNLDIDTRSDVYTLGVILYELLTGTVPFSRKELEKSGFAEMLRLIREVEPPRPSTRLSEMRSAECGVRNGKGTPHSALHIPHLQDLDWIVMKCLAKERGRRYDAANGLALDVQRYLSDKPVEACPPSVWYRFRKFARRNKPGLAVACVILFSLVLLGVGAGWALRHREAVDEDAAQTRAARLGVLREQVGRAVAEVKSDYKHGRLLEALAGVKRAEGLLAGADVPEELRPQVRQWKTDLGMVVGLAEMRLENTTLKQATIDTGRRDPAYERAFREYGIDAVAPDARAAGERIRATNISVDLAAALDDWSIICKKTRPKSDTRWTHLLAVARVADPDPWRNRLRDALERPDRDALVKLADSARVEDLPPSTLVLMGVALREAGARDRAIVWMTEAQRKHAGDFWVNQELGHTFVYGQSSQWQEALRFMTASLAIRPKSPAAQVNVGVALLNLGMHREAAAAFRVAVQLQPNSERAHQNLADVLHRIPDVEGAIDAYKEAIRLAAKSPEGKKALAGAPVLKANATPDEAMAHREALALREGLGGTHYNLGVLLQTKGCFDEAIAVYTVALALRPNSAETHANLGVSLCHTGDMDGGIESLNKALAINPKLREGYNGLGYAYQCKGDFPTAFASFMKGIQLFPEEKSFWHNLRAALKKQAEAKKAAGEVADPAEGIALHEEYIAANPDVVRARESLAEVLQDAKRYAGAAQAWREVLRLHPKDPDAHLRLGCLLCDHTGDQDGAIAAFEEAIRLKPDEAMPHTNLANALRNKGLIDKAAASFERALKLNPNLSLARNNYGNLLARQNKHAEAEVHLRAAVRLEPKNPKGHHNLAATLWRLGKIDEATAEFREAIRLKPDYVLSRANFAQMLLELGRVSETMEQLREVIQVDEKNVHAHAQLAWLLATCADEKLRDPAEAVRLANLACKLTQEKDPLGWKARGAAYYRAGQWKIAAGCAAMMAKLTSESGGGFGDVPNTLILSMALWRMGEKNVAREMYDKAVQFLADNPKALDKLPVDAADIARLRAEAEAVLGLKEGKKQPAEKVPNP